MSQPNPQFEAKLSFHFNHYSGSEPSFSFGEALHRRVPMDIGHPAGMPTIGMWVDYPAVYRSGDVATVRCRGISPPQCRDDFRADGLLACGRKLYIVSDRPGSGTLPSGPVVPSGLVECVITSHVVHRGRADSEVNACLSAAKIDK